ncbi:hypothetical protein ONZ45_g9335 [Pleurotus djamor]|nr:hypothetical protein ONZ45_g9335 [Pleurotus djamor]
MEATSKGNVVVGGSGFVGSAFVCIVKLLLLRGEDNIRIIDLQEPPQDLRGLPSVTWSRADITNAQEIRDAILAPFASGKHAQVIYLTAATLRFWERAAYTWDHTYRINVLCVRNVLEAAKDLPNAILVYTSSAGVSVPTAKYLRLEHSEESVISDETPDPPTPQSCYYRSKRLAEDLVRKANKECPTIKAAILRPGYTITGPHDRKLSSVLSLSVLPVWDGNWGSRDIFVWDCAAAHLCCERALEQNPGEVAGEAFLVSGEDTALWSLHDVRNSVKVCSIPPEVLLESSLTRDKFYAKREIKLKPVSPLLIYIAAHLIEAFLYLRYHVLYYYLGCRVFFGTAPAILPKWMGEAIYLQPSTLNYFANVRIDDSRARELLGYVGDLEQRIKNLEALLLKAGPNATSQDSTTLAQASFPTSPPSSHASPQSPSDAQDREEDLQLADGIKQLRIDEERFFGKSSSFALLHTAIGVKAENSGGAHIRNEFRRPKFWEVPRHEVSAAKPIKYIYPEPQLMDSLIDLYFKATNHILPLLHRPTFESQVAAGLHLRDEKFGSLLLTVCALGSFHSDDPRVVSSKGTDSWNSYGRVWFSQIRPPKLSLTKDPPSLFQLQFYSLAALYYQGTANPEGSWSMVGMGARYAQEAGAHRSRALPDEQPNVACELWKRASWMIIVLDKVVSAFVGRPCALHEEDYDVDYPLEVDDEYWIYDDPDVAFKQPPDKTSNIVAFNLLIKLAEILDVALRTLYSAKKPKVFAGMVGPDWEQRIVSELDSELNSWLDSVPLELRWNRHAPPSDPRLFPLSAHIFCTYYYVQIIIHRPFIAGAMKSSALSFPSLAICVNAARACTNLLHVFVHRDFIPPSPTCHMAAFTSGIVLLLNIWGAKKSQASFNVSKELAEIQKIFDILEVWRISGQYSDMLLLLATREGLTFPETESRAKKRELPEDAGAPPLLSAFQTIENANGLPSTATFPPQINSLSALRGEYVPPYAGSQNEWINTNPLQSIPLPPLPPPSAPDNMVQPTLTLDDYLSLLMPTASPSNPLQPSLDSMINSLPVGGFPGTGSLDVWSTVPEGFE